MNAQQPHETQAQPPQTLFGVRTVALLELALFLIVALFLDAVFGNGNRFWGVEPHPFWIIVIALSVQYGTGAGLTAVVFSTLALLLWNIPPQQVDQDVYGWLYDIAIVPILWLISGLAVGEARMRHIRERDELREEVEEVTERERAITESYDKVRQFKETLELRIAGQMRAATETYRAAQALEKLHPNDIMQGIEDLVKSALAPEKCSIFLLENGMLEQRLVSGWEDHEGLGRMFDSGSRLYQSVIGGQETLSVINAEHQQILGDQGVMATPIIDKENGQVLGMLKIEKLAFTEMNLQSIETFRAIGEWAGIAVVNAMYYQNALGSSMVNPQSKLMTTGFFNRFSDYISALAKRLNFNVSVLEISLNNTDALDEEARTTGGRLLAEAVERGLRSVDLAFENHQTGSSYSIILPTANAEGARIVQKKIEEELLPKVRHKARGLSYSFRVHTMHEAK